MEKKIRSILLRTLGFEKYLSLVSDIYIRMIRSGMMKAKYPELFHLKEIVKPGSVCVDIGANVGYYSVFLSQHTGKDGHVYAVEPVSLFARIFLKNTRNFALNNITLYQTALGGENGHVTMGTPVIDGVVRHGLTSVIDHSQKEGMYTYEVPLKVPDELFASLTRFDFMKCDVEGYEVFLFPHFLKTIEKFRPLIQIEISSEENRKKIIDLLKPFGYKPHRLNNGALELLEDNAALKYDRGDFYFVTGG